MSESVPQPASPSPVEFFGHPAEQIGIIVADLETAARRLSALWGCGPWRCFTFDSKLLSERTYRGSPGQFSLRIALNSQSPQIELLQPLEGPSIHHEWLEEHGEGVHHLAVVVDSLDSAIAAMAQSGYPLIQSGRGFGVTGDGGFAYFDTERDLHFVVEAIEIPSRGREPETVIP